MKWFWILMFRTKKHETRSSTLFTWRPYGEPYIMNYLTNKHVFIASLNNIVLFFSNVDNFHDVAKPMLHTV